MMRFFEISSGVRVPVSEEEQSLLDQAIADRKLYRRDLDERDREVTRTMVSRGLLNRFMDDEGRIYFAPNDAHDLWRF